LHRLGSEPFCNGACEPTQPGEESGAEDLGRNYALTIITALRIICLIVRTNTDKLTAPYINYSTWAPASVIAFEVVFARGAND
jgi:hypothetical protein